MPLTPPKPHGNDLRKGRVSEPGRAYHHRHPPTPALVRRLASRSHLGRGTASPPGSWVGGIPGLGGNARPPALAVAARRRRPAGVGATGKIPRRHGHKPDHVHHRYPVATRLSRPHLLIPTASPELPPQHRNPWPKRYGLPHKFRVNAGWLQSYSSML